MKWDQRWKFFPKWPIFFIIVINKTIKEFATYLFSMHIWPKCGDWRRFDFLQVTLTIKFNLAANRGAWQSSGWLKCLNQEAPQISQKAPEKAPKSFSLKSACILVKSATDLTPQTIFIAFLCIKLFQLDNFLKIIDVFKKSTFWNFKHHHRSQKHLFGA